MCAITAAIIKTDNHKYKELLIASQIRGQDGTGVCILSKGNLITVRIDGKASEITLPDIKQGDSVIGQNRLAIFGLGHENDQPLIGERYILVHNGNLIDFEEEFKRQKLQRSLQVDSELILRIFERDRNTINIHKLKGNFACLVLDRNLGAIYSFVKDKPLFSYQDDTGIYWFSTERIGQKVFGNKQFNQIR